MSGRAFTLFEVMVYLFLFTLISFSLGRLVVQVKRTIVLSEKSLMVPLKRALFFDIVRRDINNPHVKFYAKNNDVYLSLIHI